MGEVATFADEVVGDIMRACRGTTATRDDVAASYSLILGEDSTVDWSRVNRAIIEHWSLAGLKYIKSKAWEKSGA